MVLAWDIHSRLSYTVHTNIPVYSSKPKALSKCVETAFFGILLVDAFFGNANNSSGHVNSVSVFNQGIMGSPEPPDSGPFSYS